MKANISLFLLGICLSPLSLATVGGPQNLEVLGYEAKDQKLYLLRHYLDGRGRLPQRGPEGPVLRHRPARGGLAHRGHAGAGLRPPAARAAGRPLPMRRAACWAAVRAGRQTSIPIHSAR